MSRLSRLFLAGSAPPKADKPAISPLKHSFWIDYKYRFLLTSQIRQAIWALFPEKCQQVEHNCQQDAQEDAGDDGKVDAETSALDVNVTRKSADP